VGHYYHGDPLSGDTFYLFLWNFPGSHQTFHHVFQDGFMIRRVR
jgi:hypothetical protein